MIIPVIDPHFHISYIYIFHISHIPWNPMRIPWESQLIPWKKSPQCTRIAWRTPSPPFVSSPPAPSCCSRAPPWRPRWRGPRRGRRRSGSAACGARMRSWRSWGLEDNHLGGRFKLEKWWKMWILVTNKDIYFANQTDDFIQQKDWTQQNVSMWKILVIWGFFQALKPSQTHTHWIPISDAFCRTTPNTEFI